MTSTDFRISPLLILLAVILVGCPAPTGRTRERIPGGDPTSCPGDTHPNNGEACEGTDTCTYQLACAGGGARNVSCLCNNSVWRCDFQQCFRDAAGIDAPATCPTTPFWQGYPCTSAQRGISCQGNVLGCNNEVTSTACTCRSDNTWLCSAPSCLDAGRRDVVISDATSERADRVSLDVATSCPATPDEGGACSPGLECDYRGNCPAYCTCGSDRAFHCEFGVCTEAGVPDASDASDVSDVLDASADEQGDTDAGDDAPDDAAVSTDADPDAGIDP